MCRSRAHKHASPAASGTIKIGKVALVSSHFVVLELSHDAEAREEGVDARGEPTCRNPPGFGRTMDSDTHANQPVEAVLAKAHRELISLLQERTRIVERIGAVKQTIAGLANVFGEELLSDEILDLIDRKRGAQQSGLTRTCRATLMESDLPLTRQGVLEEVQRRQPELLAHHKSPIASITTIMNRLVHYGEARAVRTLAGKKAWQWSTLQENSTPGLGSVSQPAKVFGPHPIG